MLMFTGLMLIHFMATLLLLKFVEVHQYGTHLTDISRQGHSQIPTNIVPPARLSIHRQSKSEIIYQKQPKRAMPIGFCISMRRKFLFSRNMIFTKSSKARFSGLISTWAIKSTQRGNVHPCPGRTAKRAIDLSNIMRVSVNMIYQLTSLFIVMRNTPQSDSDSPISEVFLLNFYAIQRIEEPPEQYLGIDRNSLLVEYIALR
jgi:hypothetical protein